MVAMKALGHQLDQYVNEVIPRVEATWITIYSTSQPPGRGEGRSSM